MNLGAATPPTLLDPDLVEPFPLQRFGDDFAIVTDDYVEEEESFKEVAEILSGTGKIIVDTFGYYIPPEIKPLEFPRPKKREDIEKQNLELKMAGEGGDDGGKGDAGRETKKVLPILPILESETLGGEGLFGEAEEEAAEVKLATDRPEESKKQIVRRYTMINSKGTSIQVINYGATVVAANVLDKNNIFTDVVLGFEKMEDYQASTNQHIGGTLGRYSSLITDGKFNIGTKEFYLSQNSGQNHIYGGFFGFDKVMWDSCVYKDKVVMTYVSKDLEEGYPGNVMVQTEFSLSRNDTFTIHTSAICSKPTIMSISNNIMFNLAGHGSGPDGLKKHSILVNADRVLVSDIETGIPTGEMQHVGSTYYDLRVPRPLGKAMRRVTGGGYDQTFCLTKGLNRQSVCFAARLVHPETGRYLEIQTDQVGLHVYTCNKLPNPDPTFVDVSTPEIVETECEPQFGDNRDEWPMPVFRKDLLLCPEDEIFAYTENGDATATTTVQLEGYENDEPNASIKELFNDTDYAAVKPFDPETFYRDEAESIHEEMEGEDLFSEKLLEGKYGCTYRNHGGIVLMPQEYPDAPRFKHFPSTILQPTKTYSRTTTYKFGVIKIPQEGELIPVSVGSKRRNFM